MGVAFSVSVSVIVFHLLTSKAGKHHNNMSFAEDFNGKRFWAAQTIEKRVSEGFSLSLGGFKK